MAINLPQHSVKATGPGGARAGSGPTLETILPAPGGPGHAPRSLYIHTPFCVHKCHYCDFYSFVDNRDRQQAFVDRLIDELTCLAPHAGPLRTIFVGGGTPSLLRVDLWERLLGALHARFDLSPIIAGERDAFGAAEFTVECNPESTTPELLSVLKAGGVNRVSIGAQSFEPRHLKTLERWHDPVNVERAVENARAAGIPRQSIDLIFSIPGQSLDDWDRDLRRALALNTTHLSCYNLTYEPNTAMTKRLSLGEFEPCDEDLEAGMFEHTVQTLRDAGLERYEVSNFARVGDESRHNVAYWVQEPWLAAGPSASGHVWAGASAREGSWRFKNVPRLGDYLDSSRFSPIVDVESPDPIRLLRERIMMGVRLAIGLDARAILADVQVIKPASVEPVIAAARKLEGDGLLTVAPNRWTLTDRGFMLGDFVAGELMRTLK